MIAPVLALDIGSLFAIAFLAMSFIGWLVNLINQQNPPPPPQGKQPRAPGPRDRKIQNEIEQFLKEAMGQRGEPRPPAQPEQVRPAPKPRRQRPKRPAATPLPPGSAPAGVPVAAAEPPGRPGSGITSRERVGSQDLGANVVSHLQQHMAERIGGHVSRDLPHAVDQNVSRHLGAFMAQQRDPRTGVRPATPLALETAALLQELRQPSGMRKAMIVREILSPPRALRR